MKSCLNSAYVRWLCVLVFLTLSGQASAALVKGVTGQLKLLATINGEPAFREIVWHLRPLNKNVADKTEVTISRHSAVVDLEAGKYQVNATWGDKSETQTIIIEEGGKHNLIVNLH